MPSVAEQKALESNLNQNYASLASYLPEDQRNAWEMQKARIIAFCIKNDIFLTAGVERELPFDEDEYQNFVASTLADPASARNFRFTVKKIANKPAFFCQTTGVGGVGRLLANKLLTDLLHLFSSQESPDVLALQEWIRAFNVLKARETRFRDNFSGFESVLLSLAQKNDFFSKREAILEFCMNNQIDDLIIRINEIPRMGEFLLTGLLNFFKKSENDKGYILVNIEQAKAWVEGLREKLLAIEGNLRQMTAEAFVDVAHQFIITRRIVDETLLTHKDIITLFSRSPQRANCLLYKPFSIELAADNIIQDIQGLIQHADSKEIFLPVNFKGHWFYLLRNAAGVWSIEDSQIITKEGLVEASKDFLERLGIRPESVAYNSTKEQDNDYDCGTRLINAYRKTSEPHQSILTECLMAELSDSERDALASLENIFYSKRQVQRQNQGAGQSPLQSNRRNSFIFEADELEYKEIDSAVIPIHTPFIRRQSERVFPQPKRKVLEPQSHLDIYLPILDNLKNEAKLSEKNKKFLDAFVKEAQKVRIGVTVDEDFILGKIAMKFDDIAQLVIQRDPATSQDQKIETLKTEIKGLCEELPKRSELQAIIGISLAMVGVLAIGAAALALLTVSFGSAAALYGVITMGGFGILADSSAIGIYFFGKPKTSKLESISNDLVNSLEL